MKNSKAIGIVVICLMAFNMLISILFFAFFYSSSAVKDIISESNSNSNSYDDYDYNYDYNDNYDYYEDKDDDVIEEVANSLKEIDFLEYKNMLNSGSNFILYVKQDGCSHCMNFTPTVEKVVKEYDVNLYCINLTYIGEYYSDFIELTNVEGTPTIIMYKNKKEVDRFSGGKTESFLVSSFKDNGYIK